MLVLGSGPQKAAPCDQMAASSALSGVEQSSVSSGGELLLSHVRVGINPDATVKIHLDASQIARDNPQGSAPLPSPGGMRRSVTSSAAIRRPDDDILAQSGLTQRSVSLEPKDGKPCPRFTAWCLVASKVNSENTLPSCSSLETLDAVVMKRRAIRLA